MENLNHLLKRLLESKIDFVLIGGYAAVLHGSSQVTQDIDICAVISDENIDDLHIIQEVRPIGTFDRIKEKAVTISLFGHSCKVISLEDLIEVKRSMTRPKDKATLRELEALAQRIKR